jgi:hypothetical protein
MKPNGKTGRSREAAKEQEAQPGPENWSRIVMFSLHFTARVNDHRR